MTLHDRELYLSKSLEMFTANPDVCQKECCLFVLLVMGDKHCHHDWPEVAHSNRRKTWRDTFGGLAWAKLPCKVDLVVSSFSSTPLYSSVTCSQLEFQRKCSVGQLAVLGTILK